MAKNTIIKVEGLSKHYLLNKSAEQKSDTLYGNFLNGLKNIKNINQKRQTTDFWALQDVNFEIERGDRVGIIGRNGAGKSTLLKILSRITPPTKGRIEITGKVASLLEVGTGFHGDLSGRENIYLNGSILGMTKHEIDRKFDEIVAFAEVEKFLDTPVKRYSSGMYVRLAFAVAAHLEPEILIVDEVLAVGDIAFQKKCLGKMEDVSAKEGRTILFVSHNMGQIASLCKTGILLNKGRIELQGNIQDVISEYFNYSGNDDITEFTYDDSFEKEFYIKKITLLNLKNVECKNFAHNESINLSIEVKKNRQLSDVILGVHFYDIYDKRIFTTQIAISEIEFEGNYKNFHLQIPDSYLTPNTYYFSVGVHIPNIQVIDEKERVGNLTIYDNGSDFFKYPIGEYGVVFANSKWIY